MLPLLLCRAGLQCTVLHSCTVQYCTVLVFFVVLSTVVLSVSYIVSYLALSSPVLSCLILSRPVLSWPVLSCYPEEHTVQQQHRVDSQRSGLLRVHVVKFPLRATESTLTTPHRTGLPSIV